MRRGEGVGPRVAPWPRSAQMAASLAGGIETVRASVSTCTPSSRVAVAGGGAIVQELGSLMTQPRGQVPQLGEETTEDTVHLIFVRYEYVVVDVVCAEGAVSFRRDVFEGAWEGPHGGARAAHEQPIPRTSALLAMMAPERRWCTICHLQLLASGMVRYASLQVHAGEQHGYARALGLEVQHVVARAGYVRLAHRRDGCGVYRGVDSVGACGQILDQALGHTTGLQDGVEGCEV